MQDISKKMIDEMEAIGKITPAIKSLVLENLLTEESGSSNNKISFIYIYSPSSIFFIIIYSFTLLYVQLYCLFIYLL